MCCVGVLGNKQHWRKQGNWFWHVHVHSYLLSYFAVHCWIVWLLCSVKTFSKRTQCIIFHFSHTGVKVFLFLFFQWAQIMVLFIEHWSLCSDYCFGVVVLFIACWSEVLFTTCWSNGLHQAGVTVLFIAHWSHIDVYCFWSHGCVEQVCMPNHKRRFWTTDERNWLWTLS